MKGTANVPRKRSKKGDEGRVNKKRYKESVAYVQLACDGK